MKLRVFAGVVGSVKAEPSKDPGLDLWFTQTRCQEARQICREQFLRGQLAERSKGRPSPGPPSRLRADRPPRALLPLQLWEVRDPEQVPPPPPRRAPCTPEGIYLHCDSRAGNHQPELCASGKAHAARHEGQKRSPGPR